MIVLAKKLGTAFIVAVIFASAAGSWYVWSTLQVVQTALPVDNIEHSQRLSDLVQSLSNLEMELERMSNTPNDSHQDHLIFALDTSDVLLTNMGDTCALTPRLKAICGEVAAIIDKVELTFGGNQPADPKQLQFAKIQLRNILFQVQDTLQITTQSTLYTLSAQNEKLGVIRRNASALLSLVFITLVALGILLIVQYKTIAKRKQAEINARKAKEEAVAASRAKSDFLSSVSHELRTPLSAILGFSIMIDTKLKSIVMPGIGESDEKVLNALKKIQRNVGIITDESTRLTSLINDVLDLSKMEAKMIEWRKTPVSIKEIIEQAMSITNPLVSPKDVEIHTIVEADLPKINADRNRILQVLLNLLSNAIKFTDQGSITCRAKRVENNIQISIADTGIGLSQDSKAIIFERFRQASETLIRKHNGAGLGLSICKEIIDYHAGKIWVESELGAGSSFMFSLPID